MAVLLKADVGQQHGEINVDAVVGVADLAHLGGSGGGVHKGAHQRFGFGLVDDILRDDADEEDVHAVHPQDLCPHLFDVAGQHGNAAHQFFVHLLCQKISVQIIGVEDGDLFGVFHGAFLPVWGGGGQPMASCRAK